MNTKIVVFICAVGMASASIGPVPVATRVDPLPQYSFGYDVQDALTGDYKGHQEHRNGDLVTGSYSVVDPDGTRRIVDYAADSLNGFNAVVRREPLVAAKFIAPAPVAPVAPAPVFAPAPAPFVARAPVAAPLFAPAPAPYVARAPAPYVGPAPYVAPAPVLAPAPVYPAPIARAPLYAPAPAPLYPPRLTSPYYW
ncbi:larval cuticle protein A2B-like isoform X1 [Pieris brassicae]|uniref:Cuticle protein n=2 Tax=Pieris brassicae TaxID=7116 RepID=A0A9P0T8I6_PIEBR|nr:larval cuticle protein A2B-like isoform X1 [Pieris brassicae]CAH4027660.1 unnamed protein product [Pieris brassicae]